MPKFGAIYQRISFLGWCSERTRSLTMYPCLVPRGRRFLSPCNYRDYFRRKANLHLIDKQERFSILAVCRRNYGSYAHFRRPALNMHCSLRESDKVRFAFKRHEIYHAQDRVTDLLIWKVSASFIVCVDLTLARHKVSAYNYRLRLWMGLRFRKLSPHSALLPCRDYVKRRFELPHEWK